MVEDEFNAYGTNDHEGGDPKSSVGSKKRHKKKQRKCLLESVRLEEELEVNGDASMDEGNLRSIGKKRNQEILNENAMNEEDSENYDVERVTNGKKNSKKELSKNMARSEGEEEEEEEEEKFNGESSSEEMNPRAEAENEDKKQSLKETTNGKEEQLANQTSPLEAESNDNMVDGVKNKKKKRLLKEVAEADKQGICYLSQVPPHMSYKHVHQFFSEHGEVQRMYLAPEDPTAHAHKMAKLDCKRAGAFRNEEYSEGWVEFANKTVAKRVANLLNGEQIGGRKRSKFYYDLWNIKYLSKFKWDDLTAEIAYKNAIREQKLDLEIAAAKRERDFYLTKVDQFLVLHNIEERKKKKQKGQEESGAQHAVGQPISKIVRQFAQKKPVADKMEQSKPQLSKDILAGVFGSS